MRLGETRFFTLTSPGGEDSDTSYEQFPKRWHRFQSHLQRRFGRVEYFAVVEKQKRGAAHVHVIYRGKFIPQQWLSKAAQEAGFGKIADIRRPPKNVARYLAKYLTKDLNDPKSAVPRYFRRIRVSRNWSDWTPTLRDRPYIEWWIVDVRPEFAARSAQSRGYLVVEAPEDPEAPTNLHEFRNG